MPEKELEDKTSSNGHQSYGDWLREEAANGNVKVYDAEKIQNEQIFYSAEQRRTTTQYLINVVGAAELYKDDAKKRVLTEELKRTYFKDRRERLRFLKYVNDCEALHIPFDNAIRYLVSAVSEGRASIDDAIRLSTHVTTTARNYNYDGQKTKHPKDKLE